MVGDDAVGSSTISLIHSVIPRVAMGMPPTRTNIIDPAPHHLQL